MRFFLSIIMAICLLSISLESTIAQGLTAKQAARFDVDDNGKVDSGKELVYEIHRNNKTFAIYDVNLDGKIDQLELAQINASGETIVNSSQAVDTRLRIAQGVPVPLERDVYDFSVPANVDVSRFYLREKRIEIGINSSAKGLDSVGGASLSVIRDEVTESTDATVKAAIGYVARKHVEFPDGYKGGNFALTSASLGVFGEADGQLDTSSSRLTGGVLGQLEFLGGPAFDSQFLTGSAYYQTDFEGLSEIYGATATWQPYILGIGLGSKKRIGEFLDYTWALAAEADYKYVHEAGTLRLTDDSGYLWAGIDASVTVWPFPDMTDGRLFLKASEQYFVDAFTGNEAERFQGEVGFFFNPQRTASINLEYVNGEGKGNLVHNEFIKSTLKIRY